MRRSAWVIAPFAFANILAWAQLLSTRALILWLVFPSALAVWGVSRARTRGHAVRATAIVIATGPAMALITQAFGIDDSGPITRGVLICVTLSASAAILACTAFAWVALIPASAIGATALALGSSARLTWLVGAWIAMLGLSLLLLGPYSREELQPPDRRRRIVPVILIPALMAVVASVLATSALVVGPRPQDSPQQPTAPSSATQPDALPTPAPTPTPAPPPAATAAPVAPPAPSSPESTGLPPWAVILLSLLPALVLLVLLTLALTSLRRLVVAARWRLLRRRLRQGSPRDQMLGAWRWTRLRRAQHGQPLGPPVTPENAHDWLPHEHAVVVLAGIVRPYAFDTSAQPSPALVGQAWQQAEVASAPPRRSLRDRWRTAAHGPRRALALDGHVASPRP